MKGAEDKRMEKGPQNPMTNWSQNISQRLMNIFSNEVSSLPERSDFSEFSPHSERITLAAVDGSSSIILKGANFLIGAIRTAGVMVNRKGIVTVKKINSEPFFLNRDNIKFVYSGILGKYEKGMVMGSQRDLEGLIHRLRELEEKKMASQLVDSLERNSFVLVDGSLVPHKREMAHSTEKMYEKARNRNITLVGISKSSSISRGDTALIPLVQHCAHPHMTNNMWWLDVGRVFGTLSGDAYTNNFIRTIISKLNPIADFIFRTDIISNRKTAECLGILAEYCRDPSYPGYPYPLARAHNESIIGRGESEDLRHALRGQALKMGMSQGQWRYLSQNFHDILDRNI